VNIVPCLSPSIKANCF